MCIYIYIYILIYIVLTVQLKGLMVVGIDTYHDSAKKGRSVGAFVATMNATLTKYYSRCAFQCSMEELINALKVCMQGMEPYICLYSLDIDQASMLRQ